MSLIEFGLVILRVWLSLVVLEMLVCELLEVMRDEE